MSRQTRNDTGGLFTAILGKCHKAETESKPYGQIWVINLVTDVRYEAK